MKKFLAILIIAFLSFNGSAQNDYKDFIVTNKLIWALTSTGKLKLFDKSGNENIRQINNKSDILLIAKDKLGNLVIVDKGNEIKRFNESNDTWEVIYRHKDNCFGIVFDSKNSCYLITEKGIRDLQTGKIYFSSHSLNDQITYKDKWGAPYCYFIDKNDKIWIGFGYGEWGGNLFVYQTKIKQFQIPELGKFQINLWPIKSFFEDASSVYLSAGLQHMTTNGIIVRFDDLKASVVLESESGWSKEAKKDNSRTMVDGEYIGPATYSKILNSIYFYSQNGIFKGEKNNDLSKIENWKMILKPKLSWKHGQRDAVGSPMNVVKIVSMENDGLLFLSQNDGIGLYDDNKLKMLK